MSNQNADLLTTEERAECERLGLDVAFEREFPPEETCSLLSIWSVEGWPLCFCDDGDGDGFKVDVWRRSRSVTLTAIDIERMAFIVRVCQRIADEAKENTDD